MPTARNAQGIVIVQSRHYAKISPDRGIRRICMSRQVQTRRSLIRNSAAAAGAAAFPFVRGAYAAGRLSAFFWDHPTPSVPPAMRKLCEAWAAREKVDL